MEMVIDGLNLFVSQPVAFPLCRMHQLTPKTENPSKFSANQQNPWLPPISERTRATFCERRISTGRESKKNLRASGVLLGQKR
jgi:hypothetical protein